MKKLYAALRLGLKDSREIRRELKRPAADTPARRDVFARVDRLVERLGTPAPLGDRASVRTGR